VGYDTVIFGNTITATGTATGFHVANSLTTVSNNTIGIGRGIGMLLYSPPSNAATVTGNRLSSTGGDRHLCRIAPGAKHFRLQRLWNTMTGFATPMVIDFHLGQIGCWKEPDPKGDRGKVTMYGNLCVKRF
jgi:hypothetical protein